MADPFVLRTASGYYAYGTDAPEEVAFQRYRRHFPVLFSSDLNSWVFVGGAVVSDSQDSFWAPEVAEQDGRFYLYYSSGGAQGEDHGVRLAVADQPEGPYYPVPEPPFPSLDFSIDASPFRDPLTGDWFLFFARDFLSSPAGTGLAVARLGPDMLPVGREKTLLRASRDWQIYERNRFWYGKTWDRWYTLEGPSVILHDGKYFLFYSGGNWQGEGYGVNYAWADSPLGPYHAFEGNGAGLLRSGMGGLHGPGHCSIFVDANGIERIAFHAWDEELEKRQMHIAKLAWRKGKPFVVLQG